MLYPNCIMWLSLLHLYCKCGVTLLFRFVGPCTSLHLNTTPSFSCCFPQDSLPSSPSLTDDSIMAPLGQEASTFMPSRPGPECGQGVTLPVTPWGSRGPPGPGAMSCTGLAARANHQRLMAGCGATAQRCPPCWARNPVTCHGAAGHLSGQTAPSLLPSVQVGASGRSAALCGLGGAAGHLPHARDVQEQRLSRWLPSCGAGWPWGHQPHHDRGWGPACSCGRQRPS